MPSSNVSEKSSRAELEAAQAIPPLNPEMNIVSVEEFFTNPQLPQAFDYQTDNPPGHKIYTTDNVKKLASKVAQEKLLPKPTMMRLGELLDATHHASKAEGEPSCHLLEKCSPVVIAADKRMDGAVRQAASQFNSGESCGRYLTPPNEFIGDNTQGPGEQRTCGRAALARYAYRQKCDYFGLILSDPSKRDEFFSIFDYRFGYLTPLAGKEQEALSFLQKNINDLVLSVERVVIDNTDPAVHAIQILNASLALQGYDPYNSKRPIGSQQILDDINEVLLLNQYRAVAKVAILEAAANPGKRIPVSFTMVGGGVFGASKLVIAQALNAAFEQILSSGQNNIDIYLSVWTQNELNIYKHFAQANNLLALKRVTDSAVFAKNLTTKSAVVEEDLINRLKTVIEMKPAKPQPSSKKTLDTVIFTDDFKTDILKAMDTAIKSLSKSIHLSQQSRLEKISKLEKSRNEFKDHPENLVLIKNFIYEASKARSTKNLGLFTSKFAETSSAKAFFKALDASAKTKVLKEVFKASTIEPKLLTSHSKLAKYIRDFHTEEQNPTTSAKNDLQSSL